MRTKNLLWLPVVLAAACGGTRESAEGTGALSANEPPSTDICETYATDPVENHLVYRTCDNQTMIVDLQTGATKQMSVVGESGSSIVRYAPYLAFDEGFIVRTPGRAEMFGWDGVSRVVVTDPLLDHFDSVDVVNHYLPVDGGRTLLVWQALEGVDGQGWTLASLKASGNGPTERVDSLPDSTATSAVRAVLADGDGKRLVAWTHQGVYAVSTEVAARPTKISEFVGLPDQTTFDGHTVLATAEFSAGGRLHRIDLDTSSVTAISQLPMLNGASLRGVDSGQVMYPRADALRSLATDGSRVYFAEGIDRHRIAVYDRANPGTPPVTLAEGTGRLKSLLVLHHGAQRTPTQFLALTPDRSHLVYHPENGEAVDAVAVDGSAPPVTVAPRGADIVVAAPARLACIVDGTAQVADLRTGQRWTTALAPGADGPFFAMPAGVNFSRDGSQLFEISARPLPGTDTDFGIGTVRGGPVGTDLSLDASRIHEYSSGTRANAGYHLGELMDRVRFGSDGIGLIQGVAHHRWRLFLLRPTN